MIGVALADEPKNHLPLYEERKMKIGCKAMQEHVHEEERNGKTPQEIEDQYKKLLKFKMIDIDDFYNAMKLIYRRTK